MHSKLIHVNVIRELLNSLEHTFYQDSCKWKPYVLTGQKFYWKCGNCGKTVYTTFNEIRLNGSCKRCFREVRYEQIFSFFKENNVTLITTREDYQIGHKKIYYYCPICDKIKYSRLQGMLQRGIPVCGRCSRDKAKETLIRNHGEDYYKSEEFRSKYEETSIKNYGVANPNKSPIVIEGRKARSLEKYGVEWYLQTEEFKIKSKQTFLKNHGVEYPHQLVSVREEYKKTMMERFGVPNSYWLSSSASKESGRLFNILYKELSDEDKSHTYYASLNREFNTRNYSSGGIYKYDFVITTKKVCIEYNGSKFHPQDHQDENDTGWCVFHKDLTVKQAREYETSKFKALQDRGYTVFVVWDFEFKKEKEKTVERCIKFIRGDK